MILSSTGNIKTFMKIRGGGYINRLIFPNKSVFNEFCTTNISSTTITFLKIYYSLRTDSLSDMVLGTPLYVFLSVGTSVMVPQKCQYRPKLGSVSKDRPPKYGSIQFIFLDHYQWFKGVNPNRPLLLLEGHCFTLSNISTKVFDRLPQYDV